MPFYYYFMVCCVFIRTHKAGFVVYYDAARIPSLWDTFDMPRTPPDDMPNTPNLVHMMHIGFWFPPWPLHCFYDMLLMSPQTNFQLAMFIWCVCCVGALQSSAHAIISSDLLLIYIPRRSASLFPTNEPLILFIVVS